MYVEAAARGREDLGAPRALLVRLHALLVVRPDLHHGVFALALVAEHQLVPCMILPEHVLDLGQQKSHHLSSIV